MLRKDPRLHAVAAMKNGAGTVGMVIIIPLVAIDMLLVTHPKWNFPSSLGYTAGEFWQSEWGQRMVANYIIGGVLLLTGILSAIFIVIVSIHGAATVPPTPPGTPPTFPE